MFTAAVSAAPDAVGIPRLSAGMLLAANKPCSAADWWRAISRLEDH
jgi:hypothetical protein